MPLSASLCDYTALNLFGLKWVEREVPSSQRSSWGRSGTWKEKWNTKKQRPIKANFIWCKWLHISFSRSNVDYYNFNFLTPWESRDFLASHVPVQNDFSSPMGTSGLQNRLFVYVEQERDFFFLLIIKWMRRQRNFMVCVCAAVCVIWKIIGLGLALPLFFHPEVQLIKHNCLEKSLRGSTTTSHIVPGSHWPWKASTCHWAAEPS